MRRLLLALVLGGCAATEVTDTPMAVPSYEDIVDARAAAAQDHTTHTLRYNPTYCRCPPFEIQLGSRWQRVDLAVEDTEDPTVTELLAVVREATDQTGRTYKVDGAVTDAVGTCGAGTRFVTLEPTAFQGVTIKGSGESAP